jgi:hypothetical protein
MAVRTIEHKRWIMITKKIKNRKNRITGNTGYDLRLASFIKKGD